MPESDNDMTNALPAIVDILMFKDESVAISASALSEPILKQILLGSKGQKIWLYAKLSPM